MREPVGLPHLRTKHFRKLAERQVFHLIERAQSCISNKSVQYWLEERAKPRSLHKRRTRGRLYDRIHPEQEAIRIKVPLADAMRCEVVTYRRRLEVGWCISL